MNGMQIAFDPANAMYCYEGTGEPVQTHQSLRCKHMLFWYLSHCPVTIWLMLAWANVQSHQSSLSSGENSTQIAEIACAGSRCDLRTVYVSSEGFGGSSPATTAHLCNNRCVV